jgi:hypothetical protein
MADANYFLSFEKLENVLKNKKKTKQIKKTKIENQIKK